MRLNSILRAGKVSGCFCTGYSSDVCVRPTRIRFAAQRYSFTNRIKFREGLVSWMFVLPLTSMKPNVTSQKLVEFHSYLHDDAKFTVDWVSRNFRFKFLESGLFGLKTLFWSLNLKSIWWSTPPDPTRISWFRKPIYIYFLIRFLRLKMKHVLH